MNAVWSHPAMAHFARAAWDALQSHGTQEWKLIIDGPVGDVDNVYVIGMYDPPYYARTLEMTKGAHRIIQWCGSDTEYVNPLHLPDATHLSSDLAYSRRLEANGGPASEVVYLPNTVRFDEPQEMPELPTVGCYFGSSPQRYGEEWMRALSEALPDVRIATWQYGQYTADQMKNVYAQLTCLVQPGLTSAGCSLREMLEAGKPVLTNGLELYGALQFHEHDFNRFVRDVKKMLRAKTDPFLHEYWKQANDPAVFAAKVEAVCR